jgi:Uma2 family endonuclease
MNQLAPQRMTVAQYIDWAQAQPHGNYELEDGRVIEMPAEQVQHIELKLEVAIALRAAVKAAADECHLLTDGTTVRIDDKRAYRPDALVYTGKRLPPETIEIPSPVIVVEVLSPSSITRDNVVKLARYFSVASIEHYLILDPENRLVVHHRRMLPGNGEVATRVHADGLLALDPPGLLLTIADMFPPAEPPCAPAIR